MNIFLIGYRCTGKTIIGQKLARQLNRFFIDTDEAVMSKAGMSISTIVDQYGWDDFRQRECMVIKDISKQKNLVVATGGGCVLNFANVNMMRSGVVIWLRASPATIKARMQSSHQDHRPALTSQTLTIEIETTLEERKPLYSAAMDISIDTDQQKIEDVCKKVLQRLSIYSDAC